MKNYAVLIPRIILGLLLTLFGLMGLIQVMPDPHAFWDAQEGFAPAAKDLLLAMWDSGFMMLAVCLGHLIAGLLLITNRYVPLALAIHIPISFLMILFHLTLDPASGGMAYGAFVINAYLLYRYRHAYASLFQLKSEPI